MAKLGCRIGILGGTFDPPHLAHLRIAEEVREGFDLKEIWFCPSYSPPHRKEPPVASFAERLTMVRLATENHPSFIACDVEKELIPSYTYNALKILKKNYPEIDFYFILGWDAFSEFATWYRYQEIPKLSNLIVCTRGKINVKEAEQSFNLKVKSFVEEPLRERFFFFPVFPLEISSTQIRNLIRQGKSVRYLVPEKVYNFLQNTKLYTA